MSILLTNSRVEGGVGLMWEAGLACLKEAGRRQSIFKGDGRRHLVFLKFETFNGPTAQEG